MLGNNSAPDAAPKGRKPPVVSGWWVFGRGLPSAGVRVDSPAWVDWLMAPTTTSFAYPLFDRRCGYIIGFMTVRKERRRRGGAYWTAYRRQGRRLRKIYLGVAQAVTQARLEAIAMTLLADSAD